MKSTKNEYKPITSFENDCVWMSIRYALGRHSIASVMHAQDIADNIYDRAIATNDENFINLIAIDINKLLEEYLRYNFHFYTNTFREYTKERINYPIDQFFNFINKSKINSLSEFKDIKSIYYETNIYHVEKIKPEDNIQPLCISMMDLIDIIPWMNLAKLFNKEEHYTAKCIYCGEEKLIEYYFSYIVKYTDDIFSLVKVMIPVDGHHLNNHTINEEYVVDYNYSQNIKY